MTDGALQFDLRLPAKVVFGWGRRTEAGKLAAGLGSRAWIVCGSRTLEAAGVIDELIATLQRAGVNTQRLPTLTHEPNVADVDAAVEAVKRGLKSGDCVLAIGGGAAIDLGKAIAGLAAQPAIRSVRDYLEGVGCGLQMTEAPLALLAMPTTAGTGTEATKNAVISHTDPPFKKSLRDERLLPAAVLIDPELTVSNSRPVTAHSGMDAITQLIESYVTKKGTPFTRALCLEGLRLAGTALPKAVEEPQNREAREWMSYAAWLSGVTLANAGLGLAHGVAAALGIHAGVPHGLACAVMLPSAMRVNLEQRRSDFARIGEILTGRRFDSDEEGAEAAVSAIRALGERIGIPFRLRDLGVGRDQIPAVALGSRGNSMSGNPVDLDDSALESLLEALW